MPHLSHLLILAQHHQSITSPEPVQKDRSNLVWNKWLSTSPQVQNRFKTKNTLSQQENRQDPISSWSLTYNLWKMTWHQLVRTQISSHSQITKKQLQKYNQITDQLHLNPKLVSYVKFGDVTQMMTPFFTCIQLMLQISLS